jgi:MFS family permease
MNNPTKQKSSTTKPRVFYGWWIVLASLVADAMKHGTFNRGFTVYVVPIQAELGISTAAIGFADSLGRLAGGIQGPLVGYLTDRFGPRVMLIFGGVMSGVGFMLLAFTQSYLSFVLIFLGMLSVGFRSGYNNASAAAVNNWFRRRRGFAMSVVSIGNGLGGLVAPLTAWLVVAVGWRPAVFISGVAIILIVLPLSIVIKRTPENIGLLPDGDMPVDSSDQSADRDVEQQVVSSGVVGDVGLDFTAKEAMKTPSYWLLVAATGLRNTVHSGATFMLAPVVIWFLQGSVNNDDSAAIRMSALFVGLVAVCIVCFGPVVGVWGDRWSRKHYINKKKVSSFCMIVGAGSFLFLLDQSGNLWQLTIFAIMLGFAESANSLNWALMGDLYGRSAYATLRGWQHLPDQLLSMWTSAWMGLIYDFTGSYYWALVPLVICYLLSAVGYWIIPVPKLPERLRNRISENAS